MSWGSTISERRASWSSFSSKTVHMNDWCIILTSLISISESDSSWRSISASSSSLRSVSGLFRSVELSSGFYPSDVALGFFLTLAIVDHGYCCAGDGTLFFLVAKIANLPARLVLHFLLYLECLVTSPQHSSNPSAVVVHDCSIDKVRGKRCSLWVW